MYCRNCGSTISEDAAVCLNCGVKAGTGNKFCFNCGAQPDPQAVMCVKCGVMLNAKPAKSPSAGGTVQSNEGVSDFGGAIKTCFNKYATFSGRANLCEYWYFTLFQIILGFIPIVNIISALALLVPSLAVGVRRLHDVGKSGWWMLIGLVPLVGSILLIVWMCQKSVDGDNEYGANPNC